MLRLSRDFDVPGIAAIMAGATLGEVVDHLNLDEGGMTHGAAIDQLFFRAAAGNRGKLFVGELHAFFLGQCQDFFVALAELEFLDLLFAEAFE